GLAARAAPASEVWLFPEMLAADISDTLLVAVSRSGSTTETMRAVESYRRAGGKAAVTVGCYPDEALPRVCDLTVAVPKGQEVSVAQTRSFASMFVACQVLVGALAGDSDAAARLAKLPAHASRLLDACAGLAAQLGADMTLQRFFFLGDGPRYGLACETMLKMKEMSLAYSEAFHFLEFRHGPKSVVNDQSLVIGLVGDGALPQEAAVLTDMQALGARTLVLAEDPERPELRVADYAVRLASGLGDLDRAALCLPVLQLLAFRRALANGQDPDNPHNLTQVVTL
ncbi:MAG: SIS domain-containing protein, partial [Thiobacillaceae bacterium]